MMAMSPSRAVTQWASPLTTSAVAARAVAFFIAVRAVGLAALFAVATLQGREALQILTKWDAQWYAGIAQNGYGFIKAHPDGRLLSDYAFFPLYPVAERAVARITGLGYAEAGLLISWVAAPIAAYGIYKVVSHYTGSRTAIFTVVLWGLLPVSIVQTMAYTESLFTALAAWSLYFVQRGSWLLAGTLAASAALTRPTGVAVVLALAAAAVLDARVHWRLRATDKRATSRMTAAAVGTAIALIGLSAYPVWVALQLSSPLGYFEVTSGWENTFDGGLTFFKWVLSYFASAEFAVGILLVFATVAVFLLFIHIIRHKYPLPLVVYTGAMLILSFGTSGYFGSKPRYLIPAFVLLVPVAAWLGRSRLAVQVAFVSGATLISVAYGAYWLLGPGPP